MGFARKIGLLFLKIALALIVTFAAVEMALLILCKAGVVNMHLPSYSLANARSRFWIEENPDFGVWHEPNSSYRHVTTSYDVPYSANSYGARDRERTRESHGKKRVIVLGDSFTEGYGVKQEDRFTDRLEASTGIEHLNFGTAGSFGPTQYYLLYKTLASQFEHDAVMICILPFNDFLDDDYEYGKVAHSARYRPYFVGSEPKYELFYPGKGIEPAAPKTMENLAREFTFSGNWLKMMKGLARHNQTGLRPDYSGYLDYTPDQWRRLCHVIALIQEAAKGKEVLVVTLPAMATINRMNGETATKLSDDLSAFCVPMRMRHIDLLPAISGAPLGPQACYYKGDPHWNAYGNEIAAQAILARWPWYDVAGVKAP